MSHVPVHDGFPPRRSVEVVRATAAAFLVAAAVLVAGCNEGARPPVTFEDVAVEAGIGREALRVPRSMAHILDSTGSGVAVADYDGDGDEDVYVAGGQSTDAWLAGKPLRAGSLYRNDGGGRFTDVAVEAGVALEAWAHGAYFADVDGDGDKDLFVTAWGPNRLYLNAGDGTFTDATAESGLAGGETDWSASAAFGDLDFDGDLDLYVTNYCEYDPRDPRIAGLQWVWKGLTVFAGPRGLAGQSDRLYRNEGDGTFTEVTAESGIGGAPALYGLAVVMSDLDGDRDIDIYVANDSTVNFLWRNEGGFRFTEVGSRAGVATNDDAQTQAGMGVESGDYDGDGRFDLFVTNFSHDWNTLYRNAGEGLFADVTFRAGLSGSYLALSWGTRFLDWDNDGHLDLFVANGHIYPQVDDAPRLNTTYRQKNSLYRNRGDGTFEDVTAAAGAGLAIAESSRGVAVADFDGNGSLDIFVTNLDAPPNLLMNRGAERNHWLAIRLVGVEANRDGVGARLELDVEGTTLVREMNPFGSYLSQSQYAVHFGLGRATTTDQLVVHWPSGHTDLITGVIPGLVYTVTERKGITAEHGPTAW